MIRVSIKPILFSSEMVRAILEGRKTVTRRVVKPQPPATAHVSKVRSDYGWSFWEGNPEKHYMKPSFQAGDILWVRETWSPVNVRPRRYIYKADVDRRIGEGVGLPLCWHPSIHMPREAARIFLRLTDVRVERLQDITAEGALDEGTNVEFPEPKPSYISLAYTEMRLKPAARQSFASLWDSTIKPADRPTYGWEANPWAWVISFERCEKPEGWPC